MSFQGNITPFKIDISLLQVNLVATVNAISLTFRWRDGTEIFSPDSIYLTKVLFNFWKLPVHLVSILSRIPSEPFQIQNSRFTIKIFKLWLSRFNFFRTFPTWLGYIVHFELEDRDQAESENGKYKAWKVVARFIVWESIGQSLRQFVIALTIHVSQRTSRRQRTGRRKMATWRSESTANEIGRLERVKKKPWRPSRFIGGLSRGARPRDCAVSHLIHSPVSRDRR